MYYLKQGKMFGVGIVVGLIAGFVITIVAEMALIYLLVFKK